MELRSGAAGSTVQEYKSLKDAVLDLDPVLIRTLAAFSVEETAEGRVVLFRFAFYGPNLERPSDVEQYPDVSVGLDGAVDLKREIEELEDSDLVGALNVMHVPPGKWIVKTHAGSQGERIAWRNSIA